MKTMQTTCCKHFDNSCYHQCIALISALQLCSFVQCTDDDNRSCRNVCNMSFVSFSLAVIFIIRLFSTSAFRVPNLWEWTLNEITLYVIAVLELGSVKNEASLLCTFLSVRDYITMLRIFLVVELQCFYFKPSFKPDSFRARYVMIKQSCAITFRLIFAIVYLILTFHSVL